MFTKHDYTVHCLPRISPGVLSDLKVAYPFFTNLKHTHARTHTRSQYYGSQIVPKIFFDPYYLVVIKTRYLTESYLVVTT